MRKRNWLKGVGGVSGRAQFAESGVPGVEQLEARVLLNAAPQNDGFATHMLNWNGHPVEVVRDSWVLTFHTEQTRQQVANRTVKVAEFFGLQAERIETTATGMFSSLVVRGQVTEAMAQAAVQHFAWLRIVEPNRVYQHRLAPNDAGYPFQWGHNNTGLEFPDSGTGQLAPGVPGADIDAELAWNITTGTDRVVIAVIDTGVQLTHPDLAANIWTNPLEIPGNGIDDDGNGFIDDVNGWDFASNEPGGQDNNPNDPATQGHGTAVAGVIGAVGGNGIGVAGVMWNASILPIKIFGEVGGAPLFAIVQAQQYITILRRDYGVNIVASNNSYGAIRPDAAGEFDSAEEIAIQQATNVGILFIAAAGNDANNNDGPIFAYPASYPNPLIISVAATNNRDRLASFSNFGLTSVDVGAPGEQILTTAVGGGYQYINGTSFASPYTAGVIGLLASVNRYATPEQLRDALYAGVDVLPSLVGRVATGGRINAFRSLQLIEVPGPVVAAISPGATTAPVSEIVVQFNKDIDPAFLFPGGMLDTTRIRLRASNGDNVFNANDIFLPINHGDVTLEGNLLRITLAGGLLPRDAYRLTLSHPGFRDFAGNFLNGDTFSGNDEIYDFVVVAFRGPLEPNDTLMTATPVILSPSGRAEFFDLFIGDGLNETRDVDLFRVFVNGPALISAEVFARSLPTPSSLDPYLRLFDASGVELRANDNFNGLDPKIQYFVPSGGNYYIGVSAYPNVSYNPILAPTGVASETSGLYNITIDVAVAGSENVSATNTTPVPIPGTGVIESTIFIPDGRTITDVDVRMNILHTYVGDLRITLIGPQGQSVLLVNRRGGPGQNFTGTIFDSQAGTAITLGFAPFTGRFRPEQTLATLNNSTAQGTWTLRIEDLRAGDAGTLLDWQLDLTLTNDIFGPFELNDTILLATDLDIVGTGSRTVTAFIGDGAFGLRDVDLFRVNAGAGTTITASATPTTGALDTVLRIFDALGNQVAANSVKGTRDSIASFLVVNAGLYYVGVSGGNETSPGNFGNVDYDPFTGGSGSVSDATGSYTLTVGVAGGVSETLVRLNGNLISTGINADGSIGIYGAGQANPVGLRFGATEFLLGGGVESFFGAYFDGFVIRNAGTASQSDLGVSVSNESDFANRRALVSGLFRDSIDIRRSLSFGVNDPFIAIDVTITNRGLLPINDAAWVEGFNPQQGVFINGDARTVNNIDNATGRLAWSRVGAGPTIGLGAPAGSGVVMSFEAPGSVRDPFQVINSPFDPDAAGDTGANADLTMTVAFNLGSIDGNTSKTFRYFIFMGPTPGVVQAQFAALESGLSFGHLAADPMDPGIAAEALPYAIYYPEGFASASNSTFVPIVNANAEPVRVVVIARYEGMIAPQVLFDSSTDRSIGHIIANKRDGITITTPQLFAQGTMSNVKSEIPGREGVRKNTPYALEIRSSLPVGATLSHYDFNDISTGEAFTSTTSTAWTFGEAIKANNVQDAIVFLNPSAAPVKVTLTLYRDNAPAIVQQQTVEGNRRGGWLLRNIPGLANNTVVGVKVEGEAPIIASLTHFDSARRNGYATLGTPSLGETRGASPEGQFGVGAAEESIAILNAGTQSANVTLTFSFANGSAYRRLVVAPAEQRTAIAVNSLPGFPVGQAYSISYTSNRPVTLTLPSRSNGELTGSAFAQFASTQWLFSEGFRRTTNNTVSDYLRVYNPGTETATIAITMNFNNGESETFLRTINPRAANNFNLHQFITGLRRTQGTVPGFGSFFGVQVRSSVPIVAYQGHFDSGFGGGFGTLGTALGTTGLPA
ncbi:MAG: S8 family serine peptidase [Phycisphaeraceae bacterium]|nr:S8 family serine peptidase [Phycisphaeraceae bacterium]